MRELFQHDPQYLLGDFGSHGEKTDYPETCWPVWEALRRACDAFRRHDFPNAILNAKLGLKGAWHSDLALKLAIALWEIKADAHASMNLPKQAIRCGQRLLKICEQTTNRKFIGLAHLALGHYYHDDRMLRTALAHYQHAEKYQSDIASLKTRVEIQVSIADCLANLGQLDKALKITTHHIAHLEDSESTQHQRLRLGLLERKAFYLAWAGHHESASLLIEDVCQALERLTHSNPEWEIDLARALDHQAEILETAYRLDEALVSAEKSTALRFIRAVLHQDGSPAYLRSLVTLARLHGALGQSSQAINFCEEARQLIADKPMGSPPADLIGQIYACQGLNLMENGQNLEGERCLIAASAIFRRLGNQDGNNCTYRIAETETLIELGRMHLISEPSTSRRYLARALAWQKQILETAPSILLRAEYAETLVLLSKAEIGTRDYGAARRHLDEAIDYLTNQEVPPAGFHETALEITQAILVVVNGHHDNHMVNHFTKLAKQLCLFADLADELLHLNLHGAIRDFFRLWLDYFLQVKAPLGILQLLTFSHGRKLAEITEPGFDLEGNPENQNEDIRQLLKLRKLLQESNIELARNQHLSPTKPGTLTGGGRSASRLQLFRDYIAIREKLVVECRLGEIHATTIDPQDLIPQGGTCIAACCNPQVFGSRHPAFILLIKADGTPWLIIAPMIEKAHLEMQSLLAGWRSGGVGFRGAPYPVASKPESPTEFHGEELEAHMQQVWAALSEATTPDTRLDLVTHSDTHNLPWLSTAPAGITLRHFPSLHSRCRSIEAPDLSPPSPVRPILLLQDMTSNDPLTELYYPELEEAILHAIWPGAVSGALPASLSTAREIAAVWIIGHGETVAGQARLGQGSTGKPLAGNTIFRDRNRRIDLIYASSCYLGQTSDIESEPLGLYGQLAASRANIPVTIAATTPISDLSATVLTLLFNSIWQTQGGTATQIFRQARMALQTGEWSEHARHIFDTCCTRILPEIIEKATAHASIDRQTVEQHYGALTSGSIHARQHAIRRNGQNLLQFWQTASSHRLSPSQLILKKIGKNTHATQYWSCFG